MHTTGCYLKKSLYRCVLLHFKGFYCEREKMCMSIGHNDSDKLLLELYLKCYSLTASHPYQRGAI